MLDPFTRLPVQATGPAGRIVGGAIALLVAFAILGYTAVY